MKRPPASLWLVAALAGGCMPGRTAPRPPPALLGLHGVAPVETRDADDHLLLRMGDLQVTVPSGWMATRFGGQAMYQSLETGETLQVRAQGSDSPMDATRRREVLEAAAMLVHGTEKIVTALDGEVGPPTVVATPAGMAVDFRVTGPLTRASAHRVVASATTVLMLQVDTQSDRGEDAHTAETLFAGVRPRAVEPGDPATAPPLKKPTHP